MKKLLFGAMLLGLAISVPIPTMAQVSASVQIGIPLPPPIVFSGPPAVVLLPQTGVYVAPDLAVDLFFFDGWWWRPWEGRWYRSRYYRSGWVYYTGVPSFYGRVPSGWRNEYREHRWHGREWHYQRITHPELQQMYRRNVREQSRWQSQVRLHQATPRRTQTVRPQLQMRQQSREGGRPQQVRPQGQRHSQSPHGGGEGRR